LYFVFMSKGELNSPENTNFVEWDVFGRIQSAPTVEIIYC
jgi:hypothetical protein